MQRLTERTSDGDRVIAQVSAEVVKPLADRPYEGFVNLTTEISPMASAVYEAGRSVSSVYQVDLV